VRRLREVSPAALKEIVADGLRRGDARLLSTLDRLETNDREAAVLMRGLVDELTESCSRLRQGIPADILEVFAEAVRTMPSSDILELFVNAADTLSRMSGTIDGFNAAVYDMRDRRGFGEY
jgi:hypothetical protein